MNETTPQARAAYITRIMLLRRWHDGPGTTTVQAAKSLEMSYHGCRLLLLGLAEREELPIYRTKAGIWHARFEPRDLGPPPHEYTPTQRASVVTHRLICRYLFEHEDGLTRPVIAELLGLSPSATTALMVNISEEGGVPVYTDARKWKMEMYFFDQVVRRD